MGNDHEVEFHEIEVQLFHEIEIQLFHEIEITVMKLKFYLFMKKRISSSYDISITTILTKTDSLL